MPFDEIDMKTTVIIGNSKSILWKNLMITPRGYENKDSWYPRRPFVDDGRRGVGDSAGYPKPRRLPAVDTACPAGVIIMYFCMACSIKTPAVLLLFAGADSPSDVVGARSWAKRFDWYAAKSLLAVEVLPSVEA